MAEDHIAGPVVAWDGGPPGSKSGACTQGSSRNLGYLVLSTVMRRRGRRDRSGPGPRGTVRLRGSEEGEAVVALNEGNEVMRDGGREVGVG